MVVGSVAPVGFFLVRSMVKIGNDVIVGVILDFGLVLGCDIGFWWQWKTYGMKWLPPGHED